jgi:hypothetical protein
VRGEVVAVLSWIVLFVLLVLMVRATGCNRSSEAGTPAEERANRFSADSCNEGAGELGLARQHS